MKQEDIHYRTGGKISHAGVECLDGGRDTEFIIDRIEYKEEEMVNGRSEKGVWLMHFKPNAYTSLPVILNSTNKKRLAKLFPACEGFLARIKNAPVRMTKELTRDPNGGGQVYGLRVSMIPASIKVEDAAPKKKVLPKEKVADVVKWAKEKGVGLVGIGTYYTMDEEVKSLVESEFAK